MINRWFVNGVRGLTAPTRRLAMLMRTESRRHIAEWPLSTGDYDSRLVDILRDAPSFVVQGYGPEQK